MYTIEYILTPFNLAGKTHTVFFFSFLFFATRILVVLWPLLRPIANSNLGAILQN